LTNCNEYVSCQFPFATACGTENGASQNCFLLSVSYTALRNIQPIQKYKLVKCCWLKTRRCEQ